MTISLPGPVLVTGVAGFIASGVAGRLIGAGHQVIGVDNINDYYDRRLKHARLARLADRPGWRFVELDLAERQRTKELFEEIRPKTVIHLAAQAGVRYSLENPNAYVDSNIVATMNVLEGCRHNHAGHLVYASSSSVYGGNTKMPFATSDSVDHPLSLYAATKKANELMAHTYSHLYGLPTTGLRFFTVYGPWMRPDMVPFVFAERVRNGLPIRVFNHGRMRRDFTYGDDIVEGVLRTAALVPEANPGWTPGAHPDPASSHAPFSVYNIGNSQPVELMKVIDTLEQALGQPIEREMLDMQPGDVPATFADTDALEKATGFKPSTPIETGIGNFARWYRDEWLRIVGA